MPAQQDQLIGGLVDAATIALGLLIVVTKIGFRWKWKKSPAISVPACGVDFLNGTVVVPFGLMLASAFAPMFGQKVVAYLKSGSPVMTAIAGGIGLFFVIGELCREWR